jgi:outer membrane receptor protein involved in Fe transport
MKLSPRWTTAIYSLVRGRGAMMRITLAVAVACFSLVAVTTGKDAEAAMRRQTNIAAQGLAPALRTLAKERDVQLVYRTELVGDHQTSGAAGDLTFEEALTQLLSGTGLTYRYLDNNAITIFPIPPGSSSALSISAERVGASGSGKGDDPSKEGSQSKSFWDRFRLAQVDQGASSKSSSSEGGDKNSSRTNQNSDTSSGPKLEEIVVTASKRAEEIGQVGGAVSAISGDALAARSAESLQDYAAFIPGLTLQSQGAAGYGVVAIRGIAPQGNGSSVATYIDESPVGASGNTTRSAFFTADLDPSDLERVEVLKGPQGTLYGASSMGGVIKYVTRAPSLTTTEITASEDFNTVEHGSEGVKVRGSISTPLIDGELGLRASAYYRHDSGFIDDIGYGGNGQGRDNDRGGRLSLLYQPMEALSIRLNATIQENNTIGLTVQDTDLATGRPIYGSLKELRYEPEGLVESTRLYSAEINYRLGHFDLVSATSYSQIKPKGLADDTAGFQAYGLGPVSPQNPALDTSNDYTKKLTQEVRIVSDRMGIVEWMIGGFYQDETDHFSFVDSLTNTPEANFSTRTGDGTLKEYAGYLNGTLYFSPRFDVTMGYRHSTISQDVASSHTGSLWFPNNPDQIATNAQSFSEGASTYLAAARYHFSDDLLAYVRAASGYRPGGGRTLPPGIPPGYTDYYTSDKLWSYEAGVKVKALQGRFSADAAAFWIDWSNIQTLEPIPNSFYVINGNAGTAISRGIELQSAYVPLPGLTFGANAAFVDAHFTQTVPGVVENGQALTYVPKWSGATYAEYSRPIGNGWNAVAAGDYQYQGNRLDTYRTYLPAYSLWNARAGVRNNRWQFNLYVKNLTDKEVPVGSNGGGGGLLPYYFVMQTPRTVGVLFTQRF